jgi:hypothetical protein
MAKDAKRAPKTYGDLRKLLAAAGDPWQADPTKSDDEPLPEYPTGGDGTREPSNRTLGKGGLDKFLKTALPPSNPDLRAEWREEGILTDADEATEPERKQRSFRRKPSETPAPDSGG